jgi:hypothetical protein
MKNEQNTTENKDQPLSVVKTMILSVIGKQVNMFQNLYNSVEEKLSTDYLYGNFSRALFFVIYLTVVIALTVYVIFYRVQLHTHWLEDIARICGMQLNFNCALMIVLMLRHTARLIRTSPRLHAIIPIDDTIVIHANIGRWIVVLAVVHAVCHMIYFGIHGEGKYMPSFDYQQKQTREYILDVQYSVISRYKCKNDFKFKHQIKKHGSAIFVRHI